MGHPNSIDADRTWGPTRWGGADAPYKCFRLWAKTLAQAESTSAEH